MTWFKVDDGLADHPKMVELQERKGWHRAVALWVLAGAWCSKQLTNGRVPQVMISRLGCSKSDADLLVDTGLWRIDSAGYSFHDWERCNLTKEAVEAKREKTRTKVTDWRRNQVTAQVTGEVSNHSCNPAPLLSSPLHSLPKGEESVIAPGGADPGTPAAKTRAKREKPKSLVALQAALVDHCNDPPALSNSLAQKACRRVTEHAERNGVTLEAAASALVLAWCQAGYVANAWKLCDVPFSVRQVSLSVVGKIREGA